MEQITQEQRERREQTEGAEEGEMEKKQGRMGILKERGKKKSYECGIHFSLRENGGKLERVHFYLTLFKICSNAPLKLFISQLKTNK